MRKKPNKTSLGLMMLLLAPALAAAPIPELYNTGVDDEGNPLPVATVDPHYTITYSEDPERPGPEAYTLQQAATEFPLTAWGAGGTESKWISINPDQGNALPGTYYFDTTFDLTGLDPNKARIIGKIGADNSVSIFLNGFDMGVGAPGFNPLADFELTSGFVEGVNTLQFWVSNAGTAVGPMGLRVEMIGIVETPNEVPSIITQPVGSRVLVGENVTLTVLAQGSEPLSYQWQLNGDDIDGQVGPTLELFGVTGEQAGEYTVEITNDHGSAESNPVTVNVLEPVLSLRNTGQSLEGALLAAGEVDPNYKLVVNADGQSEDVIVQSNIPGAWLANDESSKWIGPRADTVAAAGGDYTYRTTFDLTGLNPNIAFIAGQWTSDNAGLGIVLNGQETGISQAGNFGGWNNFRIESGFVSGVNTLEFRVNNAGAGFTGLRVGQLTGGAQAVPPDSEPVISGHPVSRDLRVGQEVSFTVVATGAEPLTFQWRRNGQDIEGATSASYTVNLTDVNQAGSYTVLVSNPFGAVESQAGTLTVEPAAELDIAMFTGLSVGGLPGQQVRIEYVEAPGLNNWQTLEDITITEDPTFYLDTTSHINKTRQYRVTPIQP